MKTNTAVSIGSVALIEKVNDEFSFFKRIFASVGGKARSLIASTKLLIYNRLDECFSINQILSGYSQELFELLKFKKTPSERTLYRDLSRIGKNHTFIIENYQRFIKNEELAADKQFIDFTSSYFEGKKAAFGALGYSRDHEPGKKQLTIGVSTGINSIPTALTIQNGNVQDKKHFQFMLKTSEAVLPEGSLLIFDTGGNTKENKHQVCEKKFHYLTLKAKKIVTYKKAIEYFNNGKKVNVIINNISYDCVTYKIDDETNFVFFSEKLKDEQLALKERKFKRELEKNKSILKKTKTGKEIDEFLTQEGVVTTKGILQTTLDEVKNPYLNSLEGFFILESDVNIEPERALALYKDKDKAEKFFRSLKEGMELRPMRHWSKDAIIGYILIIFLTNFLINLTLLRAKDTVIKNTKLLKKYLRKLTLVIIYPPTGFKFQVLANICPEINAILGDYIKKYREKEIPNRW